MIRWIVALSALIMISSASYGQGFTCLWNYIPGAGPALMTACGGSTPEPDGTIVKIFWDADGNGPSPNDLQPSLCNDPPNCESGAPTGSVNLNQLPLNGVSALGQAGFFAAFDAFFSVALMPSPSRYYLVILAADNQTVLWTSNVETLVPGYQELYLTGSDWTCGSGGPRCVVVNEHE
jgi:hypothetical protein